MSFFASCFETEALRLKLALGRRVELSEDGRGGRFCEDAKADDKLDEDAVDTVFRPKEGRGRPRERR